MSWSESDGGLPWPKRKGYDIEELRCHPPTCAAHDGYECTCGWDNIVLDVVEVELWRGDEHMADWPENLAGAEYWLYKRDRDSGANGNGEVG